MRGNPHVRFSKGEIHLIGSYPNFSFARPVVKKPTFLRLRGSFEYEIQSWKYSIPLFFATQGFDTFRNREISSGAGAIREQLVDLDNFETIKVCTAYKYKGKVIDYLPNDLENAEPIYTEFKGWKQELTTTNFADLPKEIKDYIEFIEKETGVPVKIVSVGPDRNKTIFR